MQCTSHLTNVRNQTKQSELQSILTGGMRLTFAIMSGNALTNPLQCGRKRSMRSNLNEQFAGRKNGNFRQSGQFQQCMLKSKFSQSCNQSSISMKDPETNGQYTKSSMQRRMQSKFSMPQSMQHQCTRLAIFAIAVLQSLVGLTEMS